MIKILMFTVNSWHHAHLQCMIQVAVCSALDANGGYSSTGIGGWIRNEERLFNTTQRCGNQKRLDILQGEVVKETSMRGRRG